MTTPKLMSMIKLLEEEQTINRRVVWLILSCLGNAGHVICMKMQMMFIRLMFSQAVAETIVRWDTVPLDPGPPV